MRRIFPCIVAILLATSSIDAVSQEQAINKADLPDPRASIDQNPVSVGDPGVQGAVATAKTRISNASSAATDASTAARAAASTSKDVMQQQTVVGSGPSRKAELSEFQKFLFENGGRILPIFGSEFFANAPSTFAPIMSSPVPSDYALGPGDEVLIRGWGSIDIDYRATVDRNGLITIPTIGGVILGGVKAGDLETVVRGAVAKLYKGVTLNVSFGQLRAITVYVVGQASRPGTYTVSNLSTLVTALFASGGPNANGSMRRVQVKRGGKVVAELDLYAFIAHGDKSADIKLQDGDTIYIPPSLGYVALAGMVNTPALYELRSSSDTIASIVDFAGGLPVVADPRRAFLERIDPTTSQPRTVEQFALDAVGINKILKNGDVLNITSITPDFANAVVLRGSVDQPIRAAFKPGMRVSDLIPSREYLITRASTKRQNDAVQNGRIDATSREDTGALAAGIGGMLEPINWEYAVIERIKRDDLSVVLIPFNLGNVFKHPDAADNVQLQPGDTVTIFSQADVAVPADKRPVFVRVEGEVNVPGVYQMNMGETLKELLARAGGPTGNAYLFGTAFYREQVRKEQEINLQKAANRLETQLRNAQATVLANARSITATDVATAESRRQAELMSARTTIERFRALKPTGRIAFGLEPENLSFSRLPELKLENGDRLVVPMRPDFVHVLGAVSTEASLLWRKDATAGSYLKAAGLTPEADRSNIFIMRVDGSVLSEASTGWLSSSVENTVIMPGDSIVVPEKVDKETKWTKFTLGVREWAQIFANFGLGAAAIQVLRQ